MVVVVVSCNLSTPFYDLRVEEVFRKLLAFIVYGGQVDGGVEYYTQYKFTGQYHHEHLIGILDG